ncbi:hypothetical protein AB6O49_14775 [Streptomyces sp. SBR177]
MATLAADGGEADSAIGQLRHCMTILSRMSEGHQQETNSLLMAWVRAAARSWRSPISPSSSPGSRPRASARASSPPASPPSRSASRCATSTSVRCTAGAGARRPRPTSSRTS